MENISPSLDLILYLRTKLINSYSFKKTLKEYVESRDTYLSKNLSLLLIMHGKNLNLAHLLANIKSIHQKELMQLCFEGLNGVPIYEKLKNLEEEVSLSCGLELDDFLTKLTFKAMVPLFLFQLPALLLLLLGPFIIDFQVGVDF